MTFVFQNSFHGRQTNPPPANATVNRFTYSLTHERPIMKTSTFVAALALSFVASGAALAAGEATYEKPEVIKSQLSRADVVAQLNQARANGTLLITEADRQENEPFVSQRTRAEVRSETLAAIASGEVAALNGETNAFAPAPRFGTAPTQVAGK
jgi:hypothetical protein